MDFSNQSVRRLAAVKGFTLVETVLALGVVSFAMVGMLGMVPIGLENSRKAMNLTVEPSIVQSVAGDLQRTEYKMLANPGAKGSTLYFDDQGVPVATADNPNRIYTVVIGAPKALEAKTSDSADLVAAEAGRSIPVTVTNRANPAAPNSYSVIIPREKSISSL